MIFLVALRNVFRAKKRALLLGFALALVAMLFTLLRSVSSSISARMIESATTLSAGHVNVGGFSKIRKKGADAVLSGREKLLGDIKTLVPEATLIVDRNRGWGRIISQASSLNAGLSGIDTTQEERFFKSLKLAEPSEYGKPEGARGDFEEMAKPNRALIFAAQAKKLEVGVGDMLTVVIEASGGANNTVDLVVAAVAADIGFMSNWNVFVPKETLLNLYGFDKDTTGAAMVYLPNPDKADEVRKRLAEKLPKMGYDVMAHDPNPFFMKFDKVMGESWLGQKIDLTIWRDEISFVAWITTALDFVSFAVVAVLGVIIGGGIVNSMWMSVRERTKEIGTMRAIGAQRGYIVRLFLLEAFLLGLVSSAVGSFLGIVLIATVNLMDIPVTNDGVRLFLMTNEMRFVWGWGQMVFAVAVFSVLSALAAIVPSLKAAKMSPVEALMHGK
jgi:putative ABC transport system permease protein